MAKNAGRLAGLAALAGAAYMMSKDKDKGTTDSNPTRGSGRDSTETRLKTPAQSIAESDKSDKSSSISTKGESGTTTPGPDKSAPDLSESRNKPASQRSTPSKPASASAPSLAPENRNLEAGMSRGTRAAPASTSTTSSSEEGMKNYKPRRTTAAPASTVSSSAEGMKNYVPRSTPPSATKSAPPAPTKPATSPASNSRVPTSEQAAANRQEAYDKVKAVGSKVGDYVRNFETPAERRSREAKESSGMKRGGAVKKMASGGMAASKRADGIASKGKTKCKIY